MPVLARKSHMNIVLILIAVYFLFSCNSGRHLPTGGQPLSISGLHFLGEYDIPHNQAFKGTTIGGLSGIDYDPATGQYYLISDDRSAVNPARFYTARVFLNAQGIDSVQFNDVITLLQPNGKPYPNAKTDPAHTPDPEALRIDTKANQLIWSSEGERIVNKKDTVLEDPAVTIVDLKGKYVDSLSLPSLLKMHITENGPRQNGVFEGLTFADNYQTLYVNVEEPLYEDGPRADLNDNNPWIRILKFDLESRKNTAQYAYKLDPVAHPPTPSDAFKINGIPDILWIGNNRLLVIERSFSTGNEACTIKVFLADIRDASNIIDNPSLRINSNFTPISKKVLINMDSLKIYIDNIEGVTFGPELPGGRKTLLFVSDNNFSSRQKTQFLLFEIKN